MNQSKTHKISPLKYLGTVAVAWTFGAGISVLSMLVSASPGEASSRGETTAQSAADVPAAAKPSADLRSPGNAHLQIDRSGRPRVGKASFYAAKYFGRPMADGTPMRMYSNNAASLTLPLGTTARVTNLETGLSAVVTIRDRGPYVAGRIVDLSPATARRIGLELRKGVCKVQVAPLTVPMIDGTVKVMPAALRMASNS